MSSVCQWNEVLKITWEMNGEDSWTSIRLHLFFSARGVEVNWRPTGLGQEFWSAVRLEHLNSAFKHSLVK